MTTADARGPKCSGGSAGTRAKITSRRLPQPAQMQRTRARPPPPALLRSPVRWPRPSHSPLMRPRAARRPAGPTPPRCSVASSSATRTTSARASGRASVCVRVVAVAELPTRFGHFRIVAFWNNRDGKEHVAMVHGDVVGAADVPDAAPLRVPDRRRDGLAPLRLPRPALEGPRAHRRHGARASCSTCARRGAASASSTRCAPTRSRSSGPRHGRGQPGARASATTSATTPSPPTC